LPVHYSNGIQQGKQVIRCLVSPPVPCCQTRVGPFEELPEAERQDWMTSANGGYLFYLEKAKYEPAMTMLGKFFGCTD
jgi:hypothetical protein